MNVVPFESEHLHKLLISMEVDISNLLPSLDTLLLPGCSYTALNNEVPLCVAGIIPLWQGVADSYSFIHPEMKSRFKFSLHRSVSRILERVRIEKALHRVQMLVEFNYKPGYLWAESLGFKWEGVMPCYTPDKVTYVRYAKVWL